MKHPYGIYPTEVASIFQWIYNSSRAAVSIHFIGMELIPSTGIIITFQREP
jgi:hypothetical protein